MREKTGKTRDRICTSSKSTHEKGSLTFCWPKASSFRFLLRKNRSLSSFREDVFSFRGCVSLARSTASSASTLHLAEEPPTSSSLTFSPQRYRPLYSVLSPIFPLHFPSTLSLFSCLVSPDPPPVLPVILPPAILSCERKRTRRNLRMMLRRAWNTRKRKRKGNPIRNKDDWVRLERTGVTARGRQTRLQGDRIRVG